MARFQNTESGVHLYILSREKQLAQIDASRWRPPLGVSLLKSVGTLGLLFAAEVYIALQILARDFDLGSLLLAVLGFLVFCLLTVQSYALYSLLRTYYVLDSDNLTIVCGAVQHVISLGSISNVLPFKTDSLQLKTATSFLFGYPAHTGHVEGVGDVLLFCTTNSLAKMALITTSDVTFAVSPGNRDAFVEELNARRAGAQFQPQAVQRIGPRIIQLAFWQDRVAQILFLAAALGSLASFAYVSYKFPNLPPMLPLHYNSVGDIDFIGTRAEAFKIPAIGMAALVTDLIVGAAVHSREKLAAYLVLSTAVVVQVILLVATIKIVY